MAQFKYIGVQTKDDGKVDVRVPKMDGTWQSFSNIVPNTTIIDVTDERAIQALDLAVDNSGMFLYERIA